MATAIVQAQFMQGWLKWCHRAVAVVYATASSARVM